LTSGEA